jgi:hypothetical protein
MVEIKTHGNRRTSTLGGGGGMKNILTLLAAFVLFGFSFTFNSCKDCGKKETKP